jgi:hypothetical protein
VHDPRVGAPFTGDKLGAVGVGDAFPMPAVQQPQVGDGVVARGAAFGAENYWWKVLIPTMRYSSLEMRS